MNRLVTVSVQDSYFFKPYTSGFEPKPSIHEPWPGLTATITKETFLSKYVDLEVL